MNWVSLIHASVMAALAATGFAMLFNVPRRVLALCAFCGAAGVGSRLLLMGPLGGELQIAMATFAAAVVVAGIAEFLSHRMNVPPAVFSVPGVIPMVPGVFMFRSVVYWLNIAASQDGPFDSVMFGTAWQLTGTSVLILGALALGIAAPNLILYRRRPEA
jgi:uncharacterized membrane protein YjjB (DUF3815 family)